MKQILLSNGEIKYLDDDYDSVELVREYLGNEIGDCIEGMLEEAYGIASSMAYTFDDAMLHINNRLEGLGIASNSEIKSSIESIIKSTKDEIKETKEYVEYLS